MFAGNLHMFFVTGKVHVHAWLTFHPRRLQPLRLRNTLPVSAPSDQGFFHGWFIAGRNRSTFECGILHFHIWKHIFIYTPLKYYEYVCHIFHTDPMSQVLWILSFHWEIPWVHPQGSASGPRSLFLRVQRIRSRSLIAKVGEKTTTKLQPRGIWRCLNNKHSLAELRLFDIFDILKMRGATAVRISSQKCMLPQTMKSNEFLKQLIPWWWLEILSQQFG